MNQKCVEWQNMLQQTKMMSLYDKRMFLKGGYGGGNVGIIIKLNQLIIHEENELKKGTGLFYAALLDIIKEEVFSYIILKHNVTKEIIEREVENTYKMLAHIENIIASFCTRFGITSIDQHYGKLKYILLKDYDRIKSPMNVVWASVFSFLWLLSLSLANGSVVFTNEQAYELLQQIYHVTGIHEFRIFVLVLLCSNRLFCILPYSLAGLLELVVNVK
jgi:hypothetical protein